MPKSYATRSKKREPSGVIRKVFWGYPEGEVGRGSQDPERWQGDRAASKVPYKSEKIREKGKEPVRKNLKRRRLGGVEKKGLGKESRIRGEQTSA